MKTHAIIPIFIPHIGCKESCVFCDQKQITARSGAPTPEAVRETVGTWLTTLVSSESDGECSYAPSKEPEVEIAFYGGSFTAIPVRMQKQYLSIGKEYLDFGAVSGLHISTRPDCIDLETLDRLADYGVKTIELGVQSFDDEVLTASKRGHDSDTVRQACALIKEHPASFNLGIQLMIGLPGDSMESCIYSAKEAVKLKPALARLYPCVVLSGTELMGMFESGDYKPLERHEAIARTKAMYEILDDAGIYIMRVGLKSTDIINNDNLGAINEGAYHPAFRQLVESQIAKERIEKLLDEYCGSVGGTRGAQSKIAIICAPTWVSNAAGHNGDNKNYFKEKYPDIKLSFESDESLPPGKFRIIHI